MYYLCRGVLVLNAAKVAILISSIDLPNSLHCIHYKFEILQFSEFQERFSALYKLCGVDSPNRIVEPNFQHDLIYFS